MKFIPSILTAFLFAAAVSGCKDEAELPEQPLSDYEKIYMPQAANLPARLTLAVSEEPQSIVYGANYGGQDYPAADIPVTFSIDPALVDAFNQQNGTDYPALPAGSYTFPATEGVIRKGELTTQPFEIQVKTTGAAAIDLLRYYLLPVTISTPKGSIAVNEALRTTYFLVRSQPNLADYAEMDRSKWSIAGFSSEEPAEAEWGNGGQAMHMLDGDNGTFWHTAWKNASPGPPHHITVDLGEDKELHGLWFLTRQSDHNGKPKDVKVQVSTNGTDWEDIGGFSLERTQAKQKQFLSGFRTVRFFKVIFTSAYDASYCHLAELGAF